MADYGHEKTEELLAELERRIKAVYKDAKRDLQTVISEYFEQFKKRDAHQQELLRQGKITDTEYKQWRLAQIGRGKRFKAMRDHVAERVTKANEVANAYVNDATPGIYSLNRNYAAYTIEQSWGNIGYTLYDEATVKRLIVEEPDLLPYYPEKRAVRRGIDLAYGKKAVTATVTRGILQGSSIPRMAKDLETRVVTMSHDSAVRAARTAATGAQNAGRQDSFIAAKKMGIDVKKRWIATKDFRTRHEHGAADGQTVKADQPFTVGGYKMMFPGDKSAPGFLVYNCRCTMATVEKPGIEAEPRQMRVRDPATGRNVLVNEMTYSEWYEWKEKSDPEAFALYIKKNKNEAADKKLFSKYQKILQGEAPKTFADFQHLKYSSGDWELYKDYVRAIRRGELTPLADFALYKEIDQKIDKELVGITTLSGIKIAGKSKHFVSRVIGSVEQRRSGVDVSDVFEAITQRTTKVMPIKVYASGERSQKFKGEKAIVTINPDTRILVQTNPQ